MVIMATIDIPAIEISRIQSGMIQRVSLASYEQWILREIPKTNACNSLRNAPWYKPTKVQKRETTDFLERRKQISCSYLVSFPLTNHQRLSPITHPLYMPMPTGMFPTGAPDTPMLCPNNMTVTMIIPMMGRRADVAIFRRCSGRRRRGGRSMMTRSTDAIVAIHRPGLVLARQDRLRSAEMGVLCRCWRRGRRVVAVRAVRSTDTTMLRPYNRFPVMVGMPC